MFCILGTLWLELGPQGLRKPQPNGFAVFSPSCASHGWMLEFCACTLLRLVLHVGSSTVLGLGSGPTPMLPLGIAPVLSS